LRMAAVRVLAAAAASSHRLHSAEFAWLRENSSAVRWHDAVDIFKLCMLSVASWCAYRRRPGMAAYFIALLMILMIGLLIIVARANPTVPVITRALGDPKTVAALAFAGWAFVSFAREFVRTRTPVAD